MIQRIQSVYLALTTILSVLFLNGSVLSFINNSGSVIKVTFEGVLRETGIHDFILLENFLPLSIMVIMVLLSSVITIFLFKNRRIQLMFSLVLIISSVLLIATLIWSIFHISSEYDMVVVPGFMMSVPLLILVFNILAYRGIRKDDDLVKSYDRLR